MSQPAIIHHPATEVSVSEPEPKLEKRNPRARTGGKRPTYMTGTASSTLKDIKFKPILIRGVQHSNEPKVLQTRQARNDREELPRSMNMRTSMARSFKSLGRVSRRSSSYGTKSRGPKQEEQVWEQPLTKEVAKSDMLAAFKRLKLETYSDILRIKKPQSHAFQAG